MLVESFHFISASGSENGYPTRI